MVVNLMVTDKLDKLIVMVAKKNNKSAASSTL